MKFKSIILLLAILILFFSCSQSDKKETENNEVESFCDYENEIEMTVKGYYDKMSDTLLIENYEFDVKQSDLEWINDSSLVLRLMNYLEEDFYGKLDEDQYEIIISINARKGKKLSEEFYAYHDYNSGLWSRVNIVTSLGTVWFNWVSGMPAQGGVSLDYIGENQICGVLNLNVENLNSPYIGIVKLNGKFSHKKD
ncbi:MAG: hypothetical protein M0Q45_07520 [Bacteroidales bacterium]|jgi:hypothetical protein|nr:hypothetical protein [Bacteroidales bacterium]MDY0314957.1 hypothetical protein [Bacteroidales bacterium]